MITDLAYPLTVVNGNLKTVSDDFVIAAHIRSWLATEPHERIMRQNYGTTNYLFTSENAFELVAIDLKRNLTSEIPQADFDVLITPNDNGELTITINWSTNVQQTPLIFTV